MGRQTVTASERRIQTQLAMPADLPTEKRALWEREFDRFPPGYFVPADMRSMLLYLDVRQRYDRVAAIVDPILAAGKLPDKLALFSLTTATRELIRLQSALRMYPASRASKDKFNALANHPGKQAAEPGAPDDWRAMMRTAGANVAPLPRKRTRKLQ